LLAYQRCLIANKKTKAARALFHNVHTLNSTFASAHYRQMLYSRNCVKRWESPGKAGGLPMIIRLVAQSRRRHAPRS
jgi:hypothetical protein